MESGKILSSAIVGTSAMTLFSYLVSESENKNFREPEILSRLIKRLDYDYSNRAADTVGWATHYAIGILFVAAYSELWKETKIKSTLTSGALLGALSGVVGVAGWETMFKIHPNPPAKIKKKYYGHLILGHIVFGVFSAISYKLLRTDKTQK